MVDKIINKVKKSPLKTIDLEDYYPEGERVTLDIKPWLFEETILIEKDFRDCLKSHNWSQYKNSFVAITCSCDAIIPSWAYLLIATYLTSNCKYCVLGDLNHLERAIFQKIIQNLDILPFKNKPVVIKGCSSKNIPATAYIQLVKKIQPHVRSIFFGEACSTVPLYKKKHNT